MYARVYLCLFACVRVCVGVCVVWGACVCVCVCVRVHSCIHVHLCVCLSVIFASIRTYTCIIICVGENTYTVNSSELTLLWLSRL